MIMDWDKISKIFSGRLFMTRMVMLTTAVLLLIIGLLSIYAAGHPADTTGDAGHLSTPDGAWKRQIVFAVKGIFCFGIINFIDYRRLGPLAYWLYAVTLVLLAVILFSKYVYELPFAPDRKGAYRWIVFSIGGRNIFQIQPSEFCKIAYILAIAWYLRFRSNYRRFLGLVGPFAITVVAMVLIIKEPDLGTVLLMMPILFSMLFVAGARVKHLLLIVLMAVMLSPVLWHFMHSYQRMRVSSVLLQYEDVYQAARKDPKLAKSLVGDPAKIRIWKRDKGYQLIQSKQAIASGGLLGYGFAKGPYVKYNYLPDRHNDFIFAIICHQFGLVGGFIVILLYGVIVACGLEIAWDNTDPFARLIAVGIIAMFSVAVIVNICMTMGLMPITGLTLPFVSYGGSSLLVSFIGLGLLNSVGKYRPFSVAKKPFEY